MSEFRARHLAALVAALLSGLPAMASAQSDINQDNTSYGTTSAEFLLFGVEPQITRLLDQLPRLRKVATVHHTDDVVSNDAKPSVADRIRRHSPH